MRRQPTVMGHVVYEGPSALNGRPIVGVITLHSDNRKTGDMPQLWILGQNVAPFAAQLDGSDAAVCGDCPARPASGGDCYVTTWQGPRSVWETWRAGRYSHAWPSPDSRPVRLGAYGDPAALPREVVERVVATYGGQTGYTHQWRDPRHAWLREYAMASCETLEDVADAHAHGWRTFRAGSDHPTAAEILCPASDEAGKRTTCRRCRLCNGTGGNSRRSIYISRHGARARKG